MEQQKYTVSELNNVIKGLFSNLLSDQIDVDGEISNLKITNGNLFLTLKDNDSNINVICWSYHKLKNKIDIQNGDKVVISGKVTFYPKTGNFNLIMSNIEKIGLGNLCKEYEILKQKCENLGYFTESTKKQMPKNIKSIGIATAPEGAALQDILYVLKKNNFFGNIIVKRCIVQGNMCSKSIVQGIDYLNKWKDNNGNGLDVILVTRGGGSFEDLMGFSDLKVVEKIHKSNIFTISAVGHEIDYMLSDFSADMRAPTPSVAAELISRQQKYMIDMLNDNINFYNNYISDIIHKNIEAMQYKLINLQSKLKNPYNIINEKLDYLNNIETSFLNIINSKKNIYNNMILSIQQKLEKYDIDKMLNSGYVLLFKGGKIYDSIKDIEIGQKLKIKMKDGEANILINKIKSYEQ